MIRRLFSMLRAAEMVSSGEAARPTFLEAV